MLADPPHLSRHQRTPSTPPLSSSFRSLKLQTSNPSYHRNQQYSIIGLTNAAGTLVERYSYTAYGTLGIYDASGTVRTTSTYNQRYTYTGREYDPDLNLYHFRARWYDPSTGGFISRDPLGYVDGMSLYRGYFGIAWLDPTGSFSVVQDATTGSGGIVSVQVPVEVEEPNYPPCISCRPCIGRTKKDYVVTVVSRNTTKGDWRYWTRRDTELLKDFVGSNFERMVRLDINDYFLHTDDGIPNNEPDGCLIGRRVYRDIKKCVDIEYPCINVLNFSGHGGGYGGVMFNATEAIDYRRTTFWKKIRKLLCKDAIINFFSCGSGDPEDLQPIANITGATVCGCASGCSWENPGTCNDWKCSYPPGPPGPQVIGKAYDE